MKTHILFLVLIAILLSFNSNASNIDFGIDSSKTKKNEFVLVQSDDIRTLAIQRNASKTNKGQQKTLETVIYESSFFLDRGEQWYFKMNKNELPNPFQEKIQVTVSPTYGDPDLYIYGKGDSYRLIRESRNGDSEVDSETLRETDLNDNEDAAYIVLEGYTDCLLNIRIAYVNVACQEHEPAPNRRYVATWPLPVCGCDNNEYESFNQAIKAGITSWSEGECSNSFNCPDPHRVIASIKTRNNCNESPYRLYKARYKGQSVYYLDGERNPLLPDYPHDKIYNCDGDVIASTGFVTSEFVIDYDEISEKELVYECHTSQNCPDPHRIIASIKSWNDCNENPYRLYKARYKGQSVYFLDGEGNSHVYDAPSDLIYNCNGNIIASNGYVSSEFTLDYDEISGKELVYECDFNCDDNAPQIISKIKSINDCELNPYRLYKIKYKGSPAYYLDGDSDSHQIDIPSDVIYDCEGEHIADNGDNYNYLIDYVSITDYELLYECSYECNSLNDLVEELKQSTYWCNQGCKIDIYSAIYRNLPVIYVSVECDLLLDIGGAVYNCQGEMIACESYGCDPGVDQDELVLRELLWECEGDNECDRQEEDFESYSEYQKIGTQSPNWTTWSGREGGSEDGDIYVSRSTGIQTLKIARPGVQDVIYKLGNKSNGKYKLSFQIWVSNTGHFNLQADQNERVAGGVFQVIFGSNGYGEIKTNGGGRASFSYQRNSWVDVQLISDLDQNDHRLSIGSRNWTLTSVRGLTLGAIDFYAIRSAQYYVDNILLEEICSGSDTHHLTSNTRSREDLEDIDDSVSIEDIDELEIVNNPVQDILKIRRNSIQDNSEKISIINSAGQVVLQTGIDNSRINVSTLNSGLYFMLYQSDSHQQTLKFVKA